MLLRRVIAHVEKQNWAAVILDFCIVVLGVFIGLQLGNWNDTRQTRSAFFEAQDRLVAESHANLDATNNFVEDVDARLAIARSAIIALRECDAGETAYQDVLAGANAISGTLTLHLRQTALIAITNNNAFLTLLDAQERERLKEFERRLNQSQTTLNWLEARPFTNHIEESPYVDYSELSALPSIDDVMIRRLTIRATIDEVCRDQAFRKPFYLWERTATFQSLRAREVRIWLAENIEAMSEDN